VSQIPEVFVTDRTIAAHVNQGNLGVGGEREAPVAKLGDPEAILRQEDAGAAKPNEK
jgi:hypothetical protein